MLRIALLLLGSTLLLLEQYLVKADSYTQFIIFLIGIIIIGVPHGSADLLVASRNAEAKKKPFSTLRFLSVYIGRLLLFAAILWLFPLIGILLFVIFAAYHFGETDLHQFKTNTIPGKLFVISYGLLIISIIVLHHFDEVRPLYQLFSSGNEFGSIINWIALNRYYMLSAFGILFFVTTFMYFLINARTNMNEKGQFLIHMAVILIILFKLPLMLGFTFYFVIWHSVLSLSNILHYLRNDNAYSWQVIMKQILLYSLLAFIGIGLLGLTSSLLMDNNAVTGYLFIGLAVLTAPHMEIMHDMYLRIRLTQQK